MSRTKISPETLQQVITSSDECQEYLSTVVSAWQVLRQRNVANAQRGEALEQQLTKHVKDFESILNAYDRLDLELSKVNTLVTATSTLTDNINKLFDQTNKLELIRDKLMVSKNQYLIAAFELQKKKDYEQVRDQFRDEYLKTRRNVESQRQKAIERALSSHKQMLQDEYERELRKFVRTTIDEDDDDGNHNGSLVQGGSSGMTSTPDPKISSHDHSITGPTASEVSSLASTPTKAQASLPHSQQQQEPSTKTISITPSLLAIPSPNVDKYTRVNAKDASTDAFDLYSDDSTSTTSSSSRRKKSGKKGKSSSTPSSTTGGGNGSAPAKPVAKSGKEILDMYLDGSTPSIDDLP